MLISVNIAARNGAWVPKGNQRGFALQLSSLNITPSIQFLVHRIDNLRMSHTETTTTWVGVDAMFLAFLVYK